MSEREPDALLSRSELDALLAESGDAPSQPLRLGRPFRRGALSTTDPVNRFQSVRESVEDGARAWAKQLASRHQRRVSCRLIGWDEVESDGLAELLIATDRAALFQTQPSVTAGVLSLSRPLVFALLTFDFGGRHLTTGSLPTRPYTRIERRFIERVSRELLNTFVGFLRPSFGIEIGAVSLLPREGILEQASENLLLASLEVTGLGTPSRIRLGLPLSPFQTARPETPVARVTGSPAFPRSVGQLEVTLRAELGSTEMTLGRIGSLQVGDTLMLEPSLPEGLLLRVEGRPKFRAERGAVRNRMAVQIVDRLERGIRS